MQFTLVFMSIFWTSLLGSLVAQAEDMETVITDYVEVLPFPTPSTTILDANELSQYPQRPVTEILKQQAGIDLVSSGSSSQPSSLFIRGAKSEHTLVLLDGIEVYDSTTTSRSFDLSNLTAYNIERIEIYRGPQAIRFGSDAIGGVIYIVTKKGQEQSLTSTMVEAGSFSTESVALNHAGQSKNLSYSLGGQYFETDSFSSADAGSSAEKDGAQRRHISSRLEYVFSETLQAQFISRWIKSDSDLDYSGGPLGDDPNYNSSSDQTLGGVKLLGSDLWVGVKSSLVYTVHTIERRYDNNPDPVHTDDYHEKFDSQNQKLETWHHSKNWEFGIQHKTELGRTRQTLNGVASNLPQKSQYTTGIAGLWNWELSNFQGQVGVRNDTVSGVKDSIWNSSLGIKKVLTSDLAVGGQWASGFKSPSLFQRHSSFGNPSLKTEKSQSAEVYIEKQRSFIEALQLTLFENRYSELIEFDTTTSRYGNLSKAFSRGAELQLQHDYENGFELESGVSFLQTEDKTTRKRLLRRSDQSISIEGRYKIHRTNFSALYRWVGRRDDLDPVTFKRIHLDPYEVVNLQVAREISERFELKFRIDNLFDENYEEIAGYSTAPRSFYMGLAAQF